MAIVGHKTKDAKKGYGGSQKNYRKVKLSLFFIPIVIIFIVLSIKTFLSPIYPPYVYFISEDGPIENATFIVYFMTFIVALLVANSFRKTKRNLLAVSFFIIAMVFILIAMEEINWGQRIIGFETPSFFSESTQGGTSLHDLRPFSYVEDPAFIVVGFVGGLSWIIFSKLDNPKFNSFKTFFVPRWYLMSYFIPVSIFYLILNLAPPDLTSMNSIIQSFYFPKDQEPFEFILALGFLGFSLTNYLRLRHK